MIAEKTITRGGTMRALVQEGFGSADVLHLREIARPTIGEHQVLVRVRAASVNALDWHSVHGGAVMRLAAAVMGRKQKEIPVRGVDLAGVVEAVGNKVTRLKPGDEVFGAGPGAFAEYAKASENGVVEKPRGLSFEEAAAIGVAGRTALQGLRDKGGVRPGQQVLIVGAGGGVGTFAVQVAKALGATVTAVTSAANVDLVRSLGPDEVIDFTREDFTRRTARYDVVFDVAANRPLGHLRRVLKPGGIIVMAGADKKGGLAIFTRIGGALLRSRVLKQRIVFYMAQAGRDDLIVLRDLIEAGKLRPAIDRRYPLSQAADAVRYVGTGKARAKVVITID